ncbi:MAG TPA: ferritin-like domain-containing protein [Chloroflexota bacterium]|nr:ferritin-like domain-containing protein [Chloroflexota bacterium]
MSNLGIHELALPDEVPAVLDMPLEHGWVEVRVDGKVPTPKEELLALLTLAAEVEHALLVQYLYAAASLDPNASGVTAAIRSTVLTVAKQEMAHLVSVQNLLLALGGRDYLHIGRDLVRPKAIENPLPFALEPITDLVLKEYILVEAPAPDQLPEELRNRVEALRKEVWEKAGLAPHRVGEFYLQIYWLFMPDDSPAGKLQLTPNPARGLRPKRHVKPTDFADPQQVAPYQAQFDEWHGNQAPSMLILPVGNAATPRSDLNRVCLDNVYQIMQQGEGEAAGEESHFEVFLAALDRWLAGPAPKVLPLARSPYLDTKLEEAPVSTQLENVYVRQWAELLNLRYSMLMLDIGMGLATPPTDADRALLIGWAFGDMKPLLIELIAQLSSKTLLGLGPSGPTFGLLVQELPPAVRDRWGRYREFLGREKATLDFLKTLKELTTDPLGRALVGQIGSVNATRTKVVDQKLSM